MTDAARYLDRARTLGERVAPPPSPGAEKAHADALVAQLRADGLFAVAVGPAFGGPGLDLADMARITFAIARTSGSAGLIYAMHLSQALSIVRHGQGGYFEDFQRRMVLDQILLASGTSEKATGGDILHSLCTIAEAEDGTLKLTKETANISYADHAGAFLISANLVRPNGKPQQVLVLAERGQTDLTPGPGTGFLGMRGMLNSPWTVAARFSQDAVFAESFRVIASRTMTPSIHVLWAALWSGIAASALGRAKRFVTKEIGSDDELYVIARHELTQLVDRHYMMNALIRDAIALQEDEGRPAGIGFLPGARINRLKMCCSALAEDICRGALRLTGLRGYALGGPYSVAEQLQDVLSASVMISNLRLAANTSKLDGFMDEEL